MCEYNYGVYFQIQGQIQIIYAKKKDTIEVKILQTFLVKVIFSIQVAIAKEIARQKKVIFEVKK